MEIIKIENLSFAYPNRKNKVLKNINLSVKSGEFITLCGKSGCGKTTLLRLMKSSISPFGNIEGNIYFNGKPLSQTNSKEQAAKIGFVMQDPDNQIVTDKVWHELAFGLESLGFPNTEIRTRVSEMASFFGIQTWFYKKVTELSGGQKQLLNLASVMVMQPDVLILDEPTAQLDPIAAGEFLKTLEKINRELGTTIILSEHRLEEAFPISDRIIVMDNGRIIADDVPNKVGKTLKNHPMYTALPTPIKIHSAIKNALDCPITIRDGRTWLEEYTKTNKPDFSLIPTKVSKTEDTQTAIELKDVWFRYKKELPDVVKGLSIEIKKGELFAIVGGNGTGKSTALSLISGLYSPYRGNVIINGKDISKTQGLYNGILGVLPQNPQSVFVKKTVYLDFLEILSETKLPKEEKENRVISMAQLCHIEKLLDSHPYDLSGGEQQRAALAKVLLMSPQILLLDEPTKGLDAHFKSEFANILFNLKNNGVTVVMVSHDIEFCAEFVDRCAMFFDGNITSVDKPRQFFGGKNFYTTAANRMARTTIPEAVLTEDIILALGGKVERTEKSSAPTPMPKPTINADKPKKKTKKLTPARIVTGSIFALLFILTTALLVYDRDILGIADTSFAGLGILHIFLIIEIATMLFCFFPSEEFGTHPIQTPKARRKLAKRTLISTFLILLLIPLTIYIGIYFLGNRKYYFISLLIIIETAIPFFMVFEKRKPQARELIVISVLCAIAVAGRSSFFMLPQFKPVVALVIIAGVCFGGETGFLVGAVTGFVSNFFFGQGPWTPWQMFAFGIIGFFAGILFQKGFLRKTKVSLCIFGFITTIAIYGGIMNPSSVIMWQGNITKEMLISSYIVALPFDIVHGISTATFLWFISQPMIDKLERIKVKYGLVER